MSYVIKQLLTLPSLKMVDDKRYIFIIKGELVTAPKTGKNGKVETDEHGEKRISTLKVLDTTTGELGVIVVGAIGASALAMAGHITGRIFALTRKSASTGRAKPWLIEELEESATVE